jgi:hypothetical protein
VIFETRYWKQDLRRIAEALDRRSHQRTWREASHARLEREIMVGFYAIRKLNESHRLREQFDGIAVPLVSFPSLGRRIGYFVWPTVENHFDLAKPRPTSKAVKFVCDQIIHSWVFSPWFDRTNRLAGVFFSSDKKKGTEVYRMDLQRIIDLFRAAAGSRPKGWLRVAPARNRQVM